MTPLESLLVLNNLSLIGSVKTQQLLRNFGTADKVLQAKRAELTRIPGISEKIADNILHWQKKVSLKEEIAEIEKAGIKLITFQDEQYPSNLKEIYDPPIILYVKGDLLPEDKYSIALVGSRRSSNYGRESAMRLARELGANGFTVVSGLAHGIDTAAHRGALMAKGRTIGVLGSGFNDPYPSENAELIEQISQSSAVISEYSMNTHPDKINFPIRNRIISGLSLGVVIVEAPKHSGAMITAYHALNQNRMVFAVPGRIDMPSFKGTHHLIKEGAKLVENVEDILSEFQYLFPKDMVRKGAFEKEEILHPKLDPNEEKVYSILSNEEKDIDEIISKSGLLPNEVSVALLSLEMKRLVKQLPGKQFTRMSLYT